MKSAVVVGRFAPSPTGQLHFGSLVSAVGSYLASATVQGNWLIRVEDLDPPREVAGSADSILSDLKALGMQTTEPVLYQSNRSKAYQQAVDHLLNTGQAYYCGCSRKDLPESGIYPGTCRNGIPKGRPARAVRFLIEPQVISFADQVQGTITEYLSQDSGDFIIKRADGLYAYHLASVLDDHFQHVNQVVRGADLLDSTSKQICLQRALQFETPHYMHLPVVVDVDGKKLSKRHQSDPIGQMDPSACITAALHFLGQPAPASLALNELWQWALNHWDETQIPRSNSIYDLKGLN